MKLNPINKLGKYFTLLKEAHGFKSKLSLLLYAPFVPFYYMTTAFHNAFLFDVTMKNENGILFCGKSMVAIHTAASFHEKGMKELFDIDGGTFIDIGANIGKYSVYMAQKGKGKGIKVLAIEPEPNNFATLVQNIFLNRLQNDITAIDMACSDKEEVTSFYTHKKLSGSHSLFKSEKSTGIMEVRTIKLDDVIERLKIKDIRLIKMDVEGAEVEVLRGAMRTLKTWHPDVIFESGDLEKFEECEKIFKGLDYFITSLPEWNYIATWMGD